MAYTHKFNPERYEEISHITAQIPEMNPGEKLVYRGISDVGHISWLLYDWLYHIGIKSKYTIYKDKTTLTIRCKGLGPGVTCEKEAAPLTGIVSEILAEMIKSENPITLAKEKQEQGEITLTQMGELLVEYDRVMS